MMGPGRQVRCQVGALAAISGAAQTFSYTRIPAALPGPMADATSSMSD